MDIFGEYGFVIALSIATLVIVLAYGIFSRIRVEKAKKNHEHSSLMDDPRLTHKEPSRREGDVRQPESARHH